MSRKSTADKVKRDVALKDVAVTQLLMSDYGVDAAHYDEVLAQVQDIRKKGLIHDLISLSVRGFVHFDITNDLKRFLDERKAHPPKNHDTSRPRA